MNAHKPLTALPWRAALVYGVFSGERGVAEANEELDAAYIAHAANAYPRLVEALRTLTVTGNVDDPIVRALFEREAHALLRELGEK